MSDYKRYIDGRLYNTATAQKIHDYILPAKEIDGTDWITEQLYRKRSGQYFLHVAGGAGSQYADNSTYPPSDGETIIPLNVDDARAWASDHMPQDIYNKVFGTPSETERVKLTLNVSAKTIATLRELAARHSTSISAIVDQLADMDETPPPTRSRIDQRRLNQLYDLMHRADQLADADARAVLYWAIFTLEQAYDHD